MSAQQKPEDAANTQPLTDEELRPIAGGGYAIGGRQEKEPPPSPGHQAQ